MFDRRTHGMVAFVAALGVFVPQILSAELPVEHACGRNCVYVVAKLLGKAVPASELGRMVPVTENGTNLKQLQDGLREAGVASQILTLDVDAIAALGPSICLMDLDLDKASSAMGHYVVLIKVDSWADLPVSIIDGTSGRLERMTLDEFESRWTGHAVVTLPNKSLAWLFLGSFAACWLVATSFLIWQKATHSASGVRIGDKKAQLVLIVALILLMTRAHYARAEQGFMLWRDGRFDARNCAVFWAKHRGDETGYAELCESWSIVDDPMHQMNAVQLQDLLMQANVDTDVLQTSYEQFVQLPTPFVAYIEPEGNARGSYVVVIRADDHSVHYMDGGTLAYINASRDEWRRMWHGHVIVERASRSSLGIGIAAGGISVVLGGFAAFARQRKRSATSKREQVERVSNSE